MNDLIDEFGYTVVIAIVGLIIIKGFMAVLDLVTF